MVKLGTIRYINFLNVVDEEVNYDQPASTMVTGANGQGKSTMFIEGPLYLLYGTSMRYGESPGTKVMRNGAKSMLVHGNIDVNGVKLTIVRSRGNKKDEIPDGLTLLDEKGEDMNFSTPKATQEYLDKIIGLSSTSFKILNCFNADVGGFAKLSGPKQREVLDEVLMMRELDEAHQKSKSEFAEASQELEEVDTLLAEQRRTLDSLIEVLETADQRAVAWDRERDQLEAEQKASLKTLEADAKKLQKQISEMEDKLDAEHPMPSDVPPSKVPDLKIQLNKNQSIIDRQHERLLQIEKDLCDSCEQSVPPAHKDKVKADVEAQLEPVYKTISELKTRIAEEDARDAAAQVKYQKEMEKKHQADASKRTIMADIRPLRSELSDIEQKVSTIKANMVRPANPFRSTVADNEKAAEELAERVETNKVRRVALKQRVAEEAVMVELFGPNGCRRTLLEHVIPFITANTNAMLQEMESPFLSSFSVGRAGGLEVVIQSPAKAPSYDGASSGERRAADVAVLLSFIKLMRQRGSKSFGQTFFDETFDPLCDANAERVSRVLSATDGVFILTHDPDAMDASRVWRVENGKLLT